MPALNVASLSWRGSAIVIICGVPSGLTKSSRLMSSGCASMIQTKHVNVPQEELLSLVLEIRTPWAGVNESAPIRCTTSIV